MKFNLSTTAASLFLTLSALPTNAALTTIYSTNFTAPTYADGALNTAINTTTPGQDGWLNSSGGGTNNLNVANSATNGTVTLTTSGQDIRRLFTPVPNTSGTSVYLKAEITVGSAQSGDYFLHLGDGGTSNFNARTYIKSSGTGFQMALGTSSGTATYGTAVLNFATTYSLLVRYDFVTGTANDTGALFINPTTEDGSGDTAYVAATTTGTDAASISSVHLRQGNASSSAGVTVDNISVSTVPEPASALLGAFGFLALLRRRR